MNEAGTDLGTETIRNQLDDATEAIDGLAEVLDRHDDLAVVPQQICAQVLAVVPGADMASITVVDDGQGETAACTHEVVYRIDADQYRAGEGPCLHAAQTGQLVRMQVRDAQEMWPRFAASAMAAGSES
jgi:hypothetical protein